MPRIAGIDIPNERLLWTSLTYIHGIGKTTSFKLLTDLGIDPYQRARDLDEDTVSRIAKYIEDRLVVEGQLRRQVQDDIQRLVQIRCWRGTRHKQSLPCRGQQTQSNARTRKGPRRTVAGKKSVKGKKG